MKKEKFKEHYEKRIKELYTHKQKEDMIKKALQERIDTLLSYVEVYAEAHKAGDQQRLDQAAAQVVAAADQARAALDDLVKIVKKIIGFSFGLFVFTINKGYDPEIRNKGRDGLKQLKIDKEKYLADLHYKRAVIDRAKNAALAKTIGVQVSREEAQKVRDYNEEKNNS